jgi:hypothetical protein
MGALVKGVERRVYSTRRRVLTSGLPRDLVPAGNAQNAAGYAPPSSKMF